MTTNAWPTPLTYRSLLALAGEPLHGYGIIKAIEEADGGESAPSTGALYLALQRMEADGLIAAVPAPAGADGRRRYYRATERGVQLVREETRRLAALVERAREKGLLAEAR
jgi:PadR family transcriptional regulator PadR